MMRGLVKLHQNDVEQAEASLRDALTLYQELGDPYFMAHCLIGWAGVAGARHQPVRAVRLLGALERMLETIGSRLTPADRDHYDPVYAAARSQLNEAAWAAAWAEGQAMTMEEAIAYALAETRPS
jgi:hypothetical protein